MIHTFWLCQDFHRKCFWYPGDSHALELSTSDDLVHYQGQPSMSSHSVFSLPTLHSYNFKYHHFWVVNHPNLPPLPSHFIDPTGHPRIEPQPCHCPLNLIQSSLSFFPSLGSLVLQCYHFLSFFYLLVKSVSFNILSMFLLKWRTSWNTF
jgi:hypothetical protein